MFIFLAHISSGIRASGQLSVCGGTWWMPVSYYLELFVLYQLGCFTSTILVLLNYSTRSFRPPKIVNERRYGSFSRPSNDGRHRCRKGSATGPLWTCQCLKSDITASVCRALTKKWFRNMALCQTANDAINALKPSSAKTNGLDMEQGHQQRGRFRSLAAVLQNGPIECRDLLMTRYRAACRAKDVFEWQGLGFCSGLRFRFKWYTINTNEEGS